MFFATLQTARDARDLELPAAHFMTFLVWHAEEESPQTVSDVVQHLFSCGACYLGAWGAGCERVHDGADELDSGPSALRSPDGAVRMTTWHAGEELAEALECFVMAAQPDAYYAPSTRSALVLCLGSEELAADARRALVERLEQA